VAYPSCGADLKGLLKSAVLDPNPVVVLEHKGLYWSKVPGTAAAKTPEPDSEYLLPLGLARTVLSAETAHEGESRVAIITYGRGVHWALEAADELPGKVEILDLRSLAPLDEAAILDTASRCNRCLVLTEEPPRGSFAQAIAGLLADKAFEHLDAPVKCLGSMEVPAIPLNETLEQAVLPNAQMVLDACRGLLDY